MEMYGRLAVFKEKYGINRVLYRWKEDPKLGNWVRRQRSRCKDPDRIKLLEGIGFEW